MKHKLTVEQLTEMQGALNELGELDLPIWYAIAKNKNRIAKALEEPHTLRRMLYEKYADRDEKGELKYTQSKTGAIMGISDPVKYDTWYKEFVKIKDDLVEVDFHVCSVDSISSLPNKGNLFAPIIDYILVEMMPEKRGQENRPAGAEKPGELKLLP